MNRIFYNYVCIATFIFSFFTYITFNCNSSYNINLLEKKNIDQRIKVERAKSYFCTITY